MDKKIELICENIKNGYAEGVTIVGSNDSVKNKYAIEISRKLSRPYKVITFTPFTSSLDEFYDAVENGGDILVIKGIEFLNNELLNQVYYILCIVRRGEKYAIPLVPGTEVLFKAKPIYITKHFNFTCIILLNNKNAYPLTLKHRFPILMAEVDLELTPAEKDRYSFLHTVYEKDKQKFKDMEENKMKYKIVLGTGRASSLPEVEKVYINKKDGITLLKFSNGDEIRVTREKDDTDDLEKAIDMVKYAYDLNKYLDACQKKKKKPVRKPRPKKTLDTINTAMLEEIVDKITEDKEE